MSEVKKYWYLSGKEYAIPEQKREFVAELHKRWGKQVTRNRKDNLWRVSLNKLIKYKLYYGVEHKRHFNKTERDSACFTTYYRQSPFMTKQAAEMLARCNNF